MTLEKVAATWRPAPVDDTAVPEAATAAAVAGLWDGPTPTRRIPPLWHWFHFVDWEPQRQLGADGHPVQGAFLPPIEQRRRMFAGGSCTIHAPLHYAEPIRRRRRLHDLAVKTGRTGQLLFVTVRAELSQRGVLCVVEEQVIVYRSGPGTADHRGLRLATTRPEVDPAAAALCLQTDPPLLFRMSALTGNPHRIHYDLPYTVDVEHYPALVVHGPLLVLHMLELARREAPGREAPGREPLAVNFRLHSPVYLGEPLAAVAEPMVGPPRSLRIVTARDQRHASIDLRWA